MENIRLSCDICGREIFNIDELYHFTGFLNSEFSKHVHVCTECVEVNELQNKFINLEVDNEFEIA